MGTERTYVFGSGDSGGGSKLDITALLPGMMGGKGIDPSLLAMMNNKGNGFGGQDGWWSIIWLVVIASIFGWNGNGGLGGFGGRGGNGIPAELAGNAGRELLMQAIEGNANAINQIASTLNCSTQQLQSALCSIQNSITQVGNTVGMSTQQTINAIQSGNSSLLNQLATCCCNTLQAIERQGAATQLQSCQNMNALTNTMNANTLALRDGAAANTQAVLAKLDAMENQALQDKIAALTVQNSTLQNEISQRNQNATILNAVSQQIAPLTAGLQALQGDVDSIKCKLPNTVPVVYPQIKAYNPEVVQAAAYGAAAGGYAGCGVGAGFWG